MMDWLNDKKNLPIIGAATGIIVIAVVFLMIRMHSGGSSEGVGAPPSPPMGPSSPMAPSGQESEGAMPSPPGAGPAPMSPAQPAQPGMPAPTGAAPAAQTTAAVNGGKVELLPSRPDPFLPLDWKPGSSRPKPRIFLPPLGTLRIPGLQRTKAPVEQEVLPPQPTRRMAGILTNGGVYAMLETDGDTIVVKPGDIVENGNVRVDSIEPGRIRLIWLRTKKPIPIEVRMSEGTPVSAAAPEAPTEMVGPSPSPFPRPGTGRMSFPRQRRIPGIANPPASAVSM